MDPVPGHHTEQAHDQLGVVILAYTTRDGHVVHARVIPKKLVLTLTLKTGRQPRVLSLLMVGSRPCGRSICVKVLSVPRRMTSQEDWDDRRLANKSWSSTVSRK
jgi:hypothetical protein